jgi:hypothetical protein
MLAEEEDDEAEEDETFPPLLPLAAVRLDFWPAASPKRRTPLLKLHELLVDVSWERLVLFCFIIFFFGKHDRGCVKIGRQ